MYNVNKSTEFFDVCTPVVLSRIHLCVLHSVFLGEKHEGIHWTFAFCRCGTTGCPWGMAPAWLATRGLWGAGALKFITVWTDRTAGQRGPALPSHAAENIHGWGVQWGEVITAAGRRGKGGRDYKSHLICIYSSLTRNHHLCVTASHIYKILKISLSFKNFSR